MAEVKINNLENKKVDRNDLVKVANEICDGIPSVLDDDNNMTKGLFDGGKIFYLNPTEELRMGDIVKPGRRVATVLGSGDFAIDSVYNGVRDVFTFDINKFQLYPASLKIKFLQNMSYEDYCSFFTDEDNNKFMSYETYNYLKSIARSDKNLYIFMDIIFKQFDKARKDVRKNIKKDFLYGLIKEVNCGSTFDGTMLKEMINKMGISLDEDVTDLCLNYVFSRYGFSYESPEVLQLMHGLMSHKGHNNYLNSEETYDKAKSLVGDAKIKFVNCDVSNLKEKLKEVGCMNSSFDGFQSIYLSNIPEYMSGVHFRGIVDRELMDLLSDDGIIAYCCQGISSKTLRDGKSLLDSDEIEDFIADRNVLNVAQHKNNIEGYSLLKDKYDVSLDEVNSLSESNGFEDKDTFVYVKKYK